MSCLDAVPNEVLEHIAFYSGTDQLLGPPSSLPVLLTLNRKINSALSSATTPHLYARIFAEKFDIGAPLRRLGASALTATVLMCELRSRCIVLKQIRARKACFVDKIPEGGDGEDLDHILWTAYFMMLENDGKNAAQLKSYANIGEWLSNYWFEPDGASLSVSKLVEENKWPADDDRAALAMWLLWFFFDPGKYVHDVKLKGKASTVIKPFALGAHKFPLTALLWSNFRAVQSEDILIASPDSFVDAPRPSTSRLNANRSYNRRRSPKAITHFGLENIYCSPPPAAIPAILSYLALRSKEEIILPSFIEPPDADPNVQNIAHDSDAFVAYPEQDSHPKESSRWDCQWYRNLSLAGGVAQLSRSGINPRIETENLLYSGTYRLGSIEGIWEGVFSYTEFTSYASLLTGAPPDMLRSSLIAQHRQTWKLREYHLLAEVPYSASTSKHPQSGMPVVNPFPSTDPHDHRSLEQVPLPDGEALHAHLPRAGSLTMTEVADTLTFTLPVSYQSPILGMEPFTTESSELAGQRHAGNHKLNKYVYQKYRPDAIKRNGLEGDASYAARVKDVILVGEGHSSWGEFKLTGRIRAFDGFVFLSKEYIDGDRGHWLYRGYLVGAGAGAGSGHTFLPSGASSSTSTIPPESNDGYLVGRWRDTMSPITTHGYEGCFGMRRRR